MLYRHYKQTDRVVFALPFNKIRAYHISCNSKNEKDNILKKTSLIDYDGGFMLKFKSGPPIIFTEDDYMVIENAKVIAKHKYTFEQFFIPEQ